MTTSSKYLAFAVAEVDGSVSQCLANYTMLACHPYNAGVKSLEPTLVAGHFGFDQVANFATR